MTRLWVRFHLCWALTFSGMIHVPLKAGWYVGWGDMCSTWTHSKITKWFWTTFIIVGWHFNKLLPTSFHKPLNCCGKWAKKQDHYEAIMWPFHCIPELRSQSLNLHFSPLWREHSELASSFLWTKLVREKEYVQNNFVDIIINGFFFPKRDEGRNKNAKASMVSELCLGYMPRISTFIAK